MMYAELRPQRHQINHTHKAHALRLRHQYCIKTPFPPQGGKRKMFNRNFQSFGGITAMSADTPRKGGHIQSSRNPTCTRCPCPRHRSAHFGRNHIEVHYLRRLVECALRLGKNFVANILPWVYRDFYARKRDLSASPRFHIYCSICAGRLDLRCARPRNAAACRAALPLERRVVVLT